MKIDWSFPKKIAVALAGMVIVAAYPLMKYSSADFIHAAIMGALLATANVVVGYATVEYSFDKSATIFLKYVLGGMGLRLLVMAAVIAVLIAVFRVDVGGLVSSMGVCYVVFLTLEVLFIQKKVSIKQQ